jgi:hypothetical protein
MRLYDDDGNSAILIIRSTPQIPDAVCKNENHCNEIVDTIIEWHHKGASQPTHEKIHFKSISSARLQGLDASIPIREAEQIIAKTTYAVCSRAMANEHGFEHSDIFRQCLTSFSGQDAIDKPKK